VPDVARQLGPATGVVEAHHGRAGQRRAEQGDQVLGGVVEQHADVERRVPPAFGEPSGDPLAAGDDLAPRPPTVVRHEPDAVVAGPPGGQLGGGRGRGPGGTGRPGHRSTAGRVARLRVSVDGV
jgi:hypothetical protein